MNEAPNGEEGRWLYIVEPKIKEAVAATANRWAPPLDHDERDRADQNALIKLWKSKKMRYVVQEASTSPGGSAAWTKKWNDARGYAYRTGQNAAIDEFRVRPHDEDEPFPGGQGPVDPTGDTDGFIERQARQQVLIRLKALINRLPDTEQHPWRSVLLLHVQLTLNDPLAPEPVLDAEGKEALPEAEKSSPSQHEPPQRRIDFRIAEILYEDEMIGDAATERSKKRAGQRVRDHLRRARGELITRYTEIYGEPPQAPRAVRQRSARVAPVVPVPVHPDSTHEEKRR